MGRDLAHRMLARTMAVLGLAAVTAIGLGAPAGAAPSDRPDDPVVLTGAQVPTLAGAAPARVLAFKWTGKWQQVPVQVDERHVISMRQLYPEPGPAYVIGDLTFDSEVYADAKTRSGADADPTLDANDEIVFMAGDTGAPAPSGTTVPAGVVPGSATRVEVGDPNGGGTGVVYLFVSSKPADQSGGKDYVRYDFKLTRFTPGMTLIDDYGFSNSNNPEDSTVTTENYELHSTDRWMEDELRITTGGATGADILDREAVSAGGLGKCSRSEYTFSGNWNRGSDNDEGSIVAIKDGPVRAIRSYVGANSGPFVQSDHIYYASREDRAIRVRVHPIPDMFVWTDYADTAIGMTYRDQKNQDGVIIDGIEDTLEKMGDQDFQNGTYLWQQVTGSHGTATTMVTAVKDDPAPGKTDPPFTSYYLDDSAPSSSSSDKERQCGGDMKAYGASGFGIDGTFPNTDPILSSDAVPARKLSVNRVRYFGGPGQTAADAEALRDRARKPLTATAGKAQLKARAEATGGLSIRFTNRKAVARRGKVLRIKLRVANTGSNKATRIRVCLLSSKLVGKPCRKIASLGSGKARTVTIRTRVKRNARGRTLRFGYSYGFTSGRFGGSGAAPGIFVVALRR
jgi:hypothetical protein